MWFRAILPALLMLSVALSGCTWFGAEADESGAPFAGPGITVALRNDATVPYTVDIQVTDPFGDLLDSAKVVVSPNGTDEAWNVVVREPGPHRVELEYNWTAYGAAASGSDDRTVDTMKCEGVTRLAWHFPEGTETSIRYLGTTCVQTSDS